MLKTRLFSLAILTTLIVGCSTAPRPTQTKAVSNNVVEKQATPSYDPEYYIEQGQRAYTRSGDISLRNQWLLKAAEAFKIQQQCQQSQKVIHLLQPELSDNIQLTQANLILAECLMEDTPRDFNELEQLLSGMSMSVGYDKRIEYINAVVLEDKQSWIPASKAVLASSIDEPIATDKVWKMMQSLNIQDLERVVSTEPVLAPWAQLALIGRQYGLDPDTLSMAVQEWRFRFANHPLNQNFPAEIQLAASSSLLSADRIAVLLPLTGRLASQGLAIKQGVLAAYFDALKNLQQDVEESPQIQFIDSALHPAEILVEMAKDYDFVIGPLLKDTLSELLVLLPADKPLLALNRQDSKNPSDIIPASDMPQNRFYFALAPEDEAIQLARKVHGQGLENLVLVADDSNATRRMAEAFTREWRNIAGEKSNPPTLAVFSDSKTLTSSVTEALDVAQSKSRIKQIENLVTQELHALPRNRRDVDALVIFASAGQTELINPLIEASLSPFGGKSVPVFASSRSYSQNLSNNSLRDLRNLTFTDMPWMLPQSPWTDLSEQTKRLWPQQNDQLRRLFALGYDSYSIAPWLRQLHSLPALSKSGLTGRLSVLEDGTVLRNLPYGHITNDKVTVIAMD